MEVVMKKNVLITGADGFIGRNLSFQLMSRDDIVLTRLDIKDNKKSFSLAVERADFIIHLAGVNRPNDLTEYDTGNRGLTEELISLLKAQRRQVPLLVSSSIQAILDNPYGKSKLGAENAVRSYSDNTGAPTFLFRLPNVFGKWCKPNYNSVVATWCHNTARGLPIHINDPSTSLKLVYIDDVVETFIAAIDGKITPDSDGFCRVTATYEKTLGQIADILESFVQSRRNLVIPSFEDDFVRKLYGTWLSYLHEEDFSYPLDIKQDDRGWLVEFIKSNAMGQIFISKTRAGITRGNHWHHTKAEKFLVIAGKALIKLRRIDKDEIIEYQVSDNELRVLDIPVGYTHSITNIGVEDLITLFWANEIFDQGAPDTLLLEV